MSLIVLEVHLSWETVPAATSLLARMWSDSCYIVAFHEGTKIDSSHLNEGTGWPFNLLKKSVDFKTKVLFWLGQARTGQAKAELLF